MALHLARNSTVLKKCSTQSCSAFMQTLWRAASSSSTKQKIADIPPTRLTTLDNGLRVASEDTSSCSTATVGVYLDSGSAHEAAKNNGYTHFFKRMAFKGTASRSQTDLEVELENMGAEVNSFVDREITGFTISCLKENVPKAVEILSDVIRNPKLAQEDIEREKKQQFKEIDEQEADMQDVILDHLHDFAFQGTPLAQKPIGSSANISSISSQSLKDFVRDTFVSPRIVLTGSGGVDHQALTQLAAKHFGSLPTQGVETGELIPYCRYTGGSVNMREDDMSHAYAALAVKGVPSNSVDLLALQLASSVIGSWSRSDGLGIATGNGLARACFDGGIAHRFDSFVKSYSTTGLFGIYFVSDKMLIEDLVWHIQREWMGLCNTLTDSELAVVKRQYLTNLLRQNDDKKAVNEDIAMQILVKGRRTPLSELDARLEDISAAAVRDVCFEYIYDTCPVQVGLGPVEAMPQYDTVRQNMYWVRM